MAYAYVIVSSAPTVQSSYKFERVSVRIVQLSVHSPSSIAQLITVYEYTCICHVILSWHDEDLHMAYATQGCPMLRVRFVGVAGRLRRVGAQNRGRLHRGVSFCMTRDISQHPLIKDQGSRIQHAATYQTASICFLTSFFH